MSDSLQIVNYRYTYKIMKETHSVQIKEVYRDFTTTIEIVKIVNRLLDGIPSKYLNGLQSIICTNASGLNRKRRREKTISRKRKVPSNTSRGLYHQYWNGQPAYIELFIDNIFYPKRSRDDIKIPSFFRIILGWLTRRSFFRDFRLSMTIYHEIGHHIHKTQAPEFAEHEDVADMWCEKLQMHYFYRKYWYIFPFTWLFLWADRYVRKLTRSMIKTKVY